MKIKINLKIEFSRMRTSNIFWFALLIGFYGYSIFSSYNAVDDFCIDQINRNSKQLACWEERPGLFIVFSFVWIFGAFYMLLGGESHSKK